LLKRMLKSPAGIAGILVLAFGLLLGLQYDPKLYKEQRTYGIVDPYQAGEIMAKNEQKRQNREMELAMIWGSIAFGLLMLGSAAWKASRPESGEDRANLDLEDKEG